MQAGLPALTSGQFAMMPVGLVATPERAKSVAFTKPIFCGARTRRSPGVLGRRLHRRLRGQTRRAGTNSNQADFVRHRMTTARFISEATDSAAVSQLLAGNLDAIVLRLHPRRAASSTSTRGG